ncbi:hypothetical protein AVEN_267799-1 [Araneus ventricosus]|uniref:Uncharacterized protein n=1 Tax=Araneus ventricosus TaxID=182803 RepID=A0A4Y2D388_ARAVE|nr:hypothetical protein AVEN_267799-1 [Araneus ventricosus]
MTRTTPELAPPSPNFHSTPTGGRLTTTYDLTCNRPHTRRIFSGIGFRTWNPPAPKPKKLWSENLKIVFTLIYNFLPECVAFLLVVSSTSRISTSVFEPSPYSTAVIPPTIQQRPPHGVFLPKESKASFKSHNLVLMHRCVYLPFVMSFFMLLKCTDVTEWRNARAAAFFPFQCQSHKS